MVPRIMTPIGLDERKKISIEILDAVSKFCSDNDISYSLGYGRLLGMAVLFHGMMTSISLC